MKDKVQDRSAYSNSIPWALRIMPETHARLVAHCDRQGITLWRLVERLIVAFLDGEEGKKETP